MSSLLPEFSKLSRKPRCDLTDVLAFQDPSFAMVRSRGMTHAIGIEESLLFTRVRTT